jgi:hypothetical protein
MAMAKGNCRRSELACKSTPLNDSHILYPTSSLRVFEVSRIYSPPSFRMRRCRKITFLNFVGRCGPANRKGEPNAHLSLWRTCEALRGLAGGNLVRS